MLRAPGEFLQSDRHQIIQQFFINETLRFQLSIHQLDCLHSFLSLSEFSDTFSSLTFQKIVYFRSCCFEIAHNF